MRKYQFFRRLTATVLCCLLLLLCTVSAAADDEPAAPEGGGETPAVETEAVPETEYIPETEPVPETEYTPETQAYIEDVDEPDPEPTYEAPEHLDELPEAESFEIPLATAVELPDVEVSDTSLLSGVIAWLCVALGIAIIAGVLVSKRTRRRGADR